MKSAEDVTARLSTPDAAGLRTTNASANRKETRSRGRGGGAVATVGEEQFEPLVLRLTWGWGKSWHITSTPAGPLVDE